MAEYLLNNRNTLMKYSDVSLLYTPNYNGNLELLASTGYTSTTTKTLAELSTELYDGVDKFCSEEDIADPLDFIYIQTKENAVISQNDLNLIKQKINRIPDLSYNDKLTIDQDTDVNELFQYVATIDVYEGTRFATTFEYVMQFTEDDFRDYEFSDIEYTDPITNRTGILSPITVTYEIDAVGTSVYGNGVDLNVSVDYVDGVPATGGIDLNTGYVGAYGNYIVGTFTSVDIGAINADVNIDFIINALHGASATNYMLGISSPNSARVGIYYTLSNLHVLVKNNAGTDLFDISTPVNLGQRYEFEMVKTGNLFELYLDGVKYNEFTLASTEAINLNGYRVARNASVNPAIMKVFSYGGSFFDQFDCMTRLWASGDVNAYKLIGSVNGQIATINHTYSPDTTIFPYMECIPNQWYLLND